MLLHVGVSSIVCLRVMRQWPSKSGVPFRMGSGQLFPGLPELLGLLCLVCHSSSIFGGGWDSIGGGCDCLAVTEGCCRGGAGCTSYRTLLFCWIIQIATAKVCTCWTKSLNWSMVILVVGRGGCTDGNEDVGALLLERAFVFLDVVFLDRIKNILFTLLVKMGLGPSSSANLLLQILT